MSGFAPDLRARSAAVFRDTTLDVLILGGGINGAGIARDLGLRKQQSNFNLSIGLVDQGHFAGGASGKNSQLIHGGLRYLRYLQIGLVKESLRERATLRYLAPHLVEPLAFLLPVFSRMDQIKYNMGLTLYDSLAGDHKIANHREVSRKELLQLEPNLGAGGLVGGTLFYDCQVHSARLVLENLFEAASNGILMANYMKATPLRREGDSWVVEFEDAITDERFEGRAKKLIDATGAWSKPSESAPRLVRGSHLIFPRLISEDHAIAHFADDGRIIFMIPWGPYKDLTLVGTTDVDHTASPDDARISSEEIEYLVRILNRLFPTVDTSNPVAAFSSLRPLISDGSSNPTAASRERKIFNTSDGILRIQGGKYTIYRQMAEEATGLLLKEIAPWLSTSCRTAAEPICGNSAKALSRLRLDSNQIAERCLLPPSGIEKLIREYGMHLLDLLAMLPAEDYGPISRVDYARIAFAVQHEMALSLRDVLFVSTYMGFEHRWDAESLEVYANLMGAWLGWDSARQAREIMLALDVTSYPGSRH